MKYASLRENNFDLLRLLLSIIVLLVHSYNLSGALVLKPLDDFLSSELAVRAFFVISGFLIFKSFDQSRSMYSYFSRRFRRIYPAYFSIIILFSIVGWFFTDLDFNNYFSSEWLRYLLSNLAFLNFLHPNLPGLFADNAITAVNGALWTLKIEVLFYLTVPLIVKIMQRFGCWQTMLFIYCLSMLYRYGIEYYGLKLHFSAYQELIRQLPGQLVYFISGAALYYYYGLFKRYAYYFLTLAVICLLWKNGMALIEPAAVAIGVIYFCCLLKPLGNFCKYGDLSYGVYIIHFPVIQLLVQYNFYQSHPILSLLSTLILVLLLAFITWHLIEKQFLRHSSHYFKFSQS